MKFNELVRLLEHNGFRIVKEKGSIRYYKKPGWKVLIRVDYHGSKEVPKGTCQAILKAKLSDFDRSKTQQMRANREVGAIL